MTRRLRILGALLAIAASACAAEEPPPVNFGTGERFITTVADAQDDVGLGSAVAVAEDGTAYVSYLAFPEELEEGQIAEVRPIGAAFVPAVALTSISPEGLFSRGAVQQFYDPTTYPKGVEPPFGPEKVEGLDLTQENTNGTDVAIAEAGTINVVWAAPDGIYHASTAPGEESTVTQVFDAGDELSFAGPLGRPSVALDGSGAAWVAFAVNGPDDVEVIVGRQSGEGWTLETVATVGRCNGCPPPLPTGITTAGETPVVVFADPVGALRSVHLEGEDWVEVEVDDAPSAGIAVATDGETAFASYYRQDGSVVLASTTGTTWTATQVAEAPYPLETSGLGAPTTDVAAAEGRLAVTWEDQDGVHLANGTEPSDLAEIDTPSTEGGERPSVGVDAEGMLYLAWVNPAHLDLLVGILGDPEDLVLANPSPVTVSIAPEPGVDCGEDGRTVLDIVAVNIAFTPNCLVGPAGEPFTINFDNQDVGQDHNVTVFAGEDSTETVVREPAFTGPGTATYDVPALDPGEYPFQCDIHPTMTGTLAVVRNAR